MSRSFASKAVRFFSLGVYCGRHRPFRLRTRRNSKPRKPKLSPFLKIETAGSRRLGTIGEDLALAYERAELIKAGQHALAERVEMVRRTIGDSAGFDIRSFDKITGEEIHIEVKTATGPPFTPFFMSAAEVEYARTCPTRYRIYRVYTYSAQAHEIKCHVTETPLETLDFTPAIYRVRQK